MTPQRDKSRGYSGRARVGVRLVTFATCAQGRSLFGAIVVAALLTAAPSRADSREIALRVELAAPVGCPAADGFIEAIRRQGANARAARADEAARTLSLVVERREGAFIGRLAWGSVAGADVREVRAGRCEEVFEGLALAAAMELTPVAPLAEPTPPEPPRPVTTASASLPPPVVVSASSPEPSHRVALSLFAAGQQWSERGWLGAGGAVGLRWAKPGWRPRVHLAGQYLAMLGPSRALDESLWLASVELCPQEFGSSLRFAPLCGLGRAGWLRARAQAVTVPVTAQNLALDLGVASRLVWQFKAGFVELSLNAGAALTHRRWTVMPSETEVGHTGRIFCGADLGAGWEVW